MKRDCDFSRVEPRHDAINLRLEHWARWVTVKPRPWKSQPMFRLYKPPPQWEPRELRVELNTIECHEVEKVVSYWLPEKNRDALRWAYVFPFISDSKIRRELAVTREGLQELIDNGRTMVANRLRQVLRAE
jgi:hypothetical protein